MRFKRGGKPARRGWYWRWMSLEIHTVSSADEILPGNDTTKYVKLNIVTMIALALVLGGIFVVFLPSAGIVLFASALTSFLLHLFFMQVMYRAGRKICSAETEICKVTRKLLCRRCRIIEDTDDHVEMIAKAMLTAILCSVTVLVTMKVCGCL